MWLDARAIGPPEGPLYPSNEITRKGSRIRAHAAGEPSTIWLPSMRSRLIVLLFVAIASGVAAGFVGSATAGHGSRTAFTSPKVVFGMCSIPDDFRPAFVRAAGQSRLPLALLAAVASVESSFRPDERSTADAHGLLQVMPSTAKALNADTSTPDRNVLAGGRYLRLMIDRFKSTALAEARRSAMWWSCSGRTKSRRTRGSSIALSGSSAAAPRSGAACAHSRT